LLLLSRIICQLARAVAAVCVTRTKLLNSLADASLLHPSYVCCQLCARLQPGHARGLRSSLANSRKWHVKKLKHEAELFKAALLAGVQYAEGRKAVEFELTDSASEKALYVYRLLVHDKVISPMPEDQVSEKTIRHRLAAWYAHQLPDGHPLLE
jgi:hypothetical protein